MRLTHETDQFFDSLVARFKSFGSSIPEKAKRLVINSFDAPENVSNLTKELEPLLSGVLGTEEHPVTKIVYEDNWNLRALVHCTEDWQHSLLRYTEEVLSDPIQMLVASFWIFEGLEDMPELKAAKEAVRDWKEKILHELLGQLTKSEKKNVSGLAILLPLVDNLLKVDRECPSYREIQRTDNDRYRRRSNVTNWVYDIFVSCTATAPKIFTDAAKMKFKASLAFLIQLDREEVETLMFEPLFEHTRYSRSKWKMLVSNQILSVDDGTPMRIIVPALLILTAMD
jgi:hypothetical protein